MTGEGGKDWAFAKKFMTKDFKKNLLDYDCDNIPTATLNKVKRIVNDKSKFDLQKIQSVSTPAYGLAKWVKALIKYSNALKELRPRQAKLAQAEKEYRASQD